MKPLLHLVHKELLVLARDWHALLLLFAMPVMFILVMSLALRDRFATHQEVALDYYLIQADDDPLSRDVAAEIRAEPSFRLLAADAPEEELETRVARDEAHFLVVIPIVDGPELRLRCVVEPDEELASLLDRMGLRLPKRLRAPDGVHAM